MKYFKVVLATILCGISLTSFAGDHKDQKFYFGLDGGVARSTVLSDAVRDEFPGVQSKTDRATSFFKGSIGRQITPHAAIELGYFQTGNWKSTLGSHGDIAQIKADASGFELSGIVKPTLDPWGTGPFLKAGVHRSTVEAIGTYQGDTGTDKFTGTGYLLGVGYEHFINPNLTSNVAYTHYAKLGGESDIKADVFTMGIKYKF